MAKKPDTLCAGGCGKLLWSTKTSLPAGKRICRDCRSLKPKEVKGRLKAIECTCEVCGETFHPWRNSLRRTCSQSCGQTLRISEGRGAHLSVPTLSEEERTSNQRARWQSKNRKRRAILRGALSEKYTTLEIADRDSYKCGLCGKLVDMSLAAPDLGSPTIDHVLPIARGGNDTRDNVQLAHFGCNSRKGARIPELI